MKRDDRRRRSGSRLLLLVAALLSPAVLSAQTVELELAPDATEIELSLRATLHKVTGTADLERGRLLFDPEAGTVEGEVVIDASSVDTGNARRDRKMHADVLESERYESIELHPRRLLDPVAEGESATVRLSAEILIHGDRHEVELPVEVDWQGETLRYRLDFAIPYVEWGMEDPSTFLLKVAKEVEVSIRGSGTVDRSLGESVEP